MAAAKPAVQMATPVKTAPAAEAAPATEAAPAPKVEPKAAPKPAAKPAVKKAAAKPVAKPVAKKAAPKKVAAKPAAKKAAPKPAAKKAAPKKAAPKPAAVQEQVSNSIQDVTAFMNEQFGLFNNMGFDMTKNYEEIVAFNKKNMEALVQSSSILNEGLQSVSNDVVAFAQASVQENVDATKALFDFKDPKEFTVLQAKIAKESYDKFVSETNKLTDASTKLAEESWAPINDRVTDAFDTIKSQTA